MKNIQIVVKKMETRSDAPMPDAYLPSDYQTLIGMRDDMFCKPQVDESFTLFGNHRYFRSSTVVEIIEEKEDSGLFKTLNSIYSWEILKEKEDEITGKN